MNLVQLKSKIRVDGDFMDNDSMLAMSYLQSQNPEDYPENKPKPPPVHVKTAEEKADE